MGWEVCIVCYHLPKKAGCKYMYKYISKLASYVKTYEKFKPSTFKMVKGEGKEHGRGGKDVIYMIIK